MTRIRLKNTLTRKVEDFAPIDPANVRMYVCGPTVYDRAHLGNARPVVVFDVLYRLLRHVYGADHVTYVRNFTDVDDRINETALNRRAAGAPGTLEDLIRQRSDETIRWYHDDMDALGALRPDHEPRATEYIPQMIAMIQRLIDGGHAYAAQGHVLFRVRSYAAYGALSGRSVDDMIAGARVEVAPFKEDPMDFVLWKPSDGDLPGWESPWGRGRPGWHIECSAMSDALLGATFDIHAGGLDLQFPHHENEIAQSCCAHGAQDPGKGFARYWLHNEMLMVEGRKMSKSLGNFFTVLDLLFDQGVPGEVIRYVFLMTHYRRPMDWTHQKSVEAKKTLTKWHLICGGVRPSKDIRSDFIDALGDDLNTPAALAILHRLAKDGNAADLKACANFIGLLMPGTSQWFDADSEVDLDPDSRIYVINEIRKRARAYGRFDLSDTLRMSLIEAGVAVHDTKLGGGAFRDPEALKRFAHSQAQKAWRSGDLSAAKRSVELLNSAGYNVWVDAEGVSAISGFDEVVFEEHFQRRISHVLSEAYEAERALEGGE